MDDLRTAAAKLAFLAENPLPFEPKFYPLRLPKSTVSIHPVVAVDGSAALLTDNGSIWVAAVRAEALSWPGPKPIEPATRIVAATPDEAKATLETGYAAHGFEAPRVSGAEAWAGALQGLAEWQAAVAAVAKRPRLLLIDGALVGLPRHAQTMADALLAEAEKVEVPVIAVAKRSGLGDTLVPALFQAGPTEPWVVEVPGETGVFVARLHAQSQHAFRIDARDAKQIPELLPLARDALYLGYPYPLALVHNRVALTGGRVAELKAGLDREIRLHGAAAARFSADFHAVLDRNVPG